MTDVLWIGAYVCRFQVSVGRYKVVLYATILLYNCTAVLLYYCTICVFTVELLGA